MILWTFYVTILLTLFAGYMSKKLVKDSKDFLIGGGRLGTVGVTSMLMGAIIGGASTVGTSQMAFERGLGAIWFTLGLSISSIVLYFFYGNLTEKKEFMTVTGVIGKFFGDRAKTAACTVLCLGMFIHINGQVLASVSIFSSVLDFDIHISALIVCALIGGYVIFGGFWGGTIVGGIKTVLLYSTSIVCGMYLLFAYDFIPLAARSFSFNPWFNPFSNGFLKDLSLPISTVLGVTCTQIYFQSVMSARDKHVLKRSCLLTAFMIPPIGLVCTMIGMYMRTVSPDIAARDAFVLFVTNNTHPVVAGLSIAAVLISSVATGAGLALGITTICSRDVISPMFPSRSDSQSIRSMRIMIGIIISAIYFIVVSNDNSMILSWGFLSMIFRATPVFVPVLVALYFSDSISKSHESIYVMIGPILSMVWILLGLDNISSIYVGILGSLSYAFLRAKKSKSTQTNTCM